MLLGYYVKKNKQKFSGPLLQINKQKQKHVICFFCFLLGLHIAVDKFYLFHPRRALIFVQRKLQTSFFHEKQSSVKSLSQILNNNIFLDNFFVVTGQLFCEKNKPFWAHVTANQNTFQ